MRSSSPSCTACAAAWSRSALLDLSHPSCKSCTPTTAARRANDEHPANPRMAAAADDRRPTRSFLMGRLDYDLSQNTPDIFVRKTSTQRIALLLPRPRPPRPFLVFRVATAKLPAAGGARAVRGRVDGLEQLALPREQPLERGRARRLRVPQRPLLQEDRPTPRDAPVLSVGVRVV